MIPTPLIQLFPFYSHWYIYLQFLLVDTVGSKFRPLIYLLTIIPRWNNCFQISTTNIFASDFLPLKQVFTSLLSLTYLFTVPPADTIVFANVFVHDSPCRWYSSLIYFLQFPPLIQLFPICRCEYICLRFPPADATVSKSQSLMHLLLIFPMWNKCLQVF